MPLLREHLENGIIYLFIEKLQIRKQNFVMVMHYMFVLAILQFLQTTLFISKR